MGIAETALILLGVGIISEKFGAGAGLGELGTGIRTLAGAPLGGVGMGLGEFATGLRSIAEALGDIGRGFGALFGNIPGYTPPGPLPPGGADPPQIILPPPVVPPPVVVVEPTPVVAWLTTDSGGGPSDLLTGGGGSTPSPSPQFMGIGPSAPTYSWVNTTPISMTDERTKAVTMY